MYNALANKFGSRFDLSRDDRTALEAILNERVRRAGPHQDIIREGEKPGEALLILSGWACCHKTLRDGRRQITSILLPGDFTELSLPPVGVMDHSIGALSPVIYAEVSRELLDHIAKARPKLARALAWTKTVELATQREWALNVGQRSAFERVSHLLCELFLRMSAAGRTFKDTCEFPITQSDLGDATGLSPVYINRTLKTLRAMDLIVLRERQLEVCDLAGLKRAGLFSANYLHLQKDSDLLRHGPDDEVGAAPPKAAALAKETSARAHSLTARTS